MGNEVSMMGDNNPSKQALVVDDGLVERLLGKTMLEKLGFSVHMAGSAEEALQLIERHKVDLVLCDIAMPGMDGLQLLNYMRSHPDAPLFIMSTVHNDAEHAVASMRLGADGYLIKPLRFEHLRDTVTEVMEKHRHDLDKARRAENQIRIDSLTNLINKNEFLRLLVNRPQENRVQENVRENQDALLLVKLSGLSHINHSYGRTAGNKVLQFAAATLARSVRPTDTLARFGGDLFAIHIKGVSHQQLEERAQGIVSHVEEAKMVLSDGAYSLNIVVGGACSGETLEMEDLFNRADFALHLAREHSRSQVHIYSEADEIHKRELARQLDMLALARAALKDRTRIVMHYQPVINLGTGALSHYEALLRVTDGQGGYCHTGELVKVCEVYGLIRRLDQAIIELCLHDMLRLPVDATIAINLSGKSIGDPELLEFIENGLEKTGIDPRRLIFELTETAAFYNIGDVRHFVQRIKNMGCRFALDDFGVGFSSFYYIKELDFDYLKLDGSFVTKLSKNTHDQVFVRAMVEISKVFGLRVIAEWVEDQETVDMLCELGVTMGQGYFFGKPASLNALVRNTLH